MPHKNPWRPARSAKEQFNRQAAHYDARWNSWSAETLATLVRLAEPQPHHVVLDAATGTGFTALAIAPYVQHIVGVDVSEAMLVQAAHQARERGLTNIEFHLASVEQLPLPNDSFHRVTCRLAAHHFTSVPAFLREAHRVLKPQGYLLIADTTAPANLAAAEWMQQVETLRDPSHVRNYTELEWRQMLYRAGFQTDVCEVKTEAIPLRFSEWVHKAGCTEEQIAQLRSLFETHLPDEAKQCFSIAATPDGDIAFAWPRVLLRAYRHNEASISTS
ncbi:methylase involved in ubiquinone/menaquinone biosynthesis [Chthonomonas calidirosea]|uniref:Methylase involved in ubiquinone/menaquinone biosynthesis n=1 Tax=Chthonomonas calidirosea (strain DSM 23976 / ICMP 18418 / T49) TaxID=1303518 RepID=S0EXV6_CHTCT|nr:class I SAM-dependent methyltransferase [Chthonomonas calidirosea]CCW36529.1 Methylase involved in ubiquinone/menaquinone biosynthesis [Chthonomonas calidirosea T49]CEK17064.1 methylase involved in ubiquinone/menaquinone biosynthesis [Chthonomonas calidirosea]